MSGTHGGRCYYLLYCVSRALTARRRRPCSEEHEKFMKEHAGHESMHAEMMLVLLVTLVCSQVRTFVVQGGPLPNRHAYAGGRR